MLLKSTVILSVADSEATKSLETAWLALRDSVITKLWEDDSEADRLRECSNDRLWDTDSNTEKLCDKDTSWLRDSSTYTLCEAETERLAETDSETDKLWDSEAAWLKEVAVEQEREGINLTCHDYLIPYYEKHGFVNEGISQSNFAGETWYDMVWENKK